MTLSLPDAVSTYFRISNGAGPGAVEDCFTHDALVFDEGRTHRGHEAIASWKREARGKFDYTVEPLRASRHHDRLTVTANVVGNFPGSPVELDHVFELAGDRIVSLRIG